MKPTPNELAILAHEIALVYGTLEEWMIRKIVQRLVEGAPTLPAEVEDWRIQKILASAAFRRDSIAVMRKVLGDIPPQVDRMLFRTARESVDGGDGATLQEAWERGLIRTMPEPEMAAKTTFMLEKLNEQALDRMNLVNTSMLVSAQQQYIDTLNIAAGFMLSGESPYVAMKTATRKLVREGLTGFYDRAGRRWEPQSAVEMILRTTGNSAANQAAFTRMDEVGCDVIVVSSHLGARPKCSLVQGKLFSRSGTTKTVKDKHGAVWQVGDWNKTSYGEPDGILGINCRHHIGMFFDGLSENKQEQVDETKNRERYEQEQKQRKLERELRKAKRERDVAKEIGDEDGARLANRKARAKSKELRDHIAKYDLRRSKVRERFYASSPVQRGLGLSDAKTLDSLDQSSTKVSPIGRLNINKPGALERVLHYQESRIADQDHEFAVVIDRNGNVYRCEGVEDRVHPEVLGIEVLRGSTVSHNHPLHLGEPWGFGPDDYLFFRDYDLAKLRVIAGPFIDEYNRSGICPQRLPTLFEMAALSEEKLKELTRYYDAIRKAIQNGWGFRRIRR